MMKQLLYKEWTLARHPTTLLFPLLAAMLLIPNYPYYVAFFYITLAVFFICLTGRENRDIFYTALLPVSRSDIVRARVTFVVILEVFQLLLAIPLGLLRQSFPLPGNAVGMNANLSLIALALPMLGLFNLVFFSRYYANPAKVGTAFAWGSTVVAVYMLIAETLTHILPFFRDVLDTPDTQHLGVKFFVLALGAVIYAVLNLWTLRRCGQRFEQLDL